MNSVVQMRSSGWESLDDGTDVMIVLFSTCIPEGEGLSYTGNPWYDKDRANHYTHAIECIL